MTVRLAVLIAAALLALTSTSSAALAQTGGAAPVIGSPSAILVEPATGDVVFQKDANAPRAVASTTKLMTALLTLERLNLDDTLAAVPYTPGPAESLCGLRAGEKLTVRDMLRCLLVVSGNDAAATLAVRVAGSRPAFVRLMNQRARQLGLGQTHYVDPIGLSPEDKSTATDLVKLTLVLRTKPFFREVVDEAKVTLKSGRPRTLVNRNLLLQQYDFVNGVKTGHTNTAGYVLVGSATRGGITVVSAVLGAASERGRVADSVALLRYGLRRYRISHPVKKGRRYATAALKYRDQRVALIAQRTVTRTARRGEALTHRVVGAPSVLEGPLAQGARVGTIEVRQRGKVVARVPLVTRAPVAAATARQRLSHFLSESGTMVLLGVFVVCSLLLVLLRRRAMRGRSGAGETEVA